MKNESGFTLIELLIVVAIIGILAAIAIPSLLNALDRTKQTKSIERITALAGFVEQYIMDNNKVGVPKVGNNIQDLIDIFETNEINFNKSLDSDGWGALFVISMEAAASGRGYTIMSLGSDFAPGPAPVTAGVVKRFQEDLIWTQGRYSQRPEGTQTND